MAHTKHIYLHIGINKAASKTIQEGLYQNRSQLLQAGWLVPEAGSPHQRAHHYLPWQLNWLGIEQNDPHSFKKLIAEIEQSPAERIIISSEAFWNCTPSMIQLLQEVLRDFHFTIIAYLRRQDYWFQSHWLQRLKIPQQVSAFALLPFETWLEKMCFQEQEAQQVGRASDRIGHSLNGDFLLTLDQWAAVFGVEQIRVRVLEAEQLQGHVFHDFLAGCDVPEVEQFTLPPDMNLSPGLKTVRGLQHLIGRIEQVECLPHHDDATTGRLARRVYQLMLEYGEQKGWNDPRASYIAESLHHRIMNQFEASNALLARKYLGRDRLFYEPFEEKLTPEYVLGKLTGEEVLDMVAYVIPRLANWMQEYNQLPQVFEASNESEQIAILQQQVNLLHEELHIIYKTRGWRLLNIYWQLRSFVRSLLPLPKRQLQRR